MSAKEHKYASPRTHSLIRQVIYSGKVIIMFIFILFCFFNAVASQMISPLYFQLVKENPQAEVQFIKTVRLLPEFQAIFPEIRETFVTYEKDVYADERKRRQTIQELENLLEENAQARDVLYALSLLYEHDGNQTKANEYLQRAHQIDPIL